MSQTFNCDGPECGVEVDEYTNEAGYWQCADDEDDDPEWTVVHFCSWVCHANWAMAAAMEQDELVE